MSSKLVVIYIGILVLLCGCATLPKPNGTMNTILIAKLELHASGYNNYNGISVNGDHKQFIRMTLMNVTTEKELAVVSDSNGFVYTTTLDPGDYTIKQLYFKAVNGDSWADVYSVFPEADRRFSIKKGMINNLGSIVWTAAFGENTRFTYNREYELTITEFRKIDSEDSWGEIDNRYVTLGSVANAPPSKIGIEKIYWAILNIPRNFFKNWKSDTTCAVGFTIKMEKGFEENTIANAYFVNQSGTYTFNTKDSMNPSHGMIGTSGQTFSQMADDVLGSDVFFIGPTQFYVKFTDGTVAKKIFDIPEPNSKTSRGFDAVYTEDWKPLPKALNSGKDIKMIPALRRPIVNSVAISGGFLDIQFSEADSRCYSGWVEFFDENEKYLLSSEPFLGTTAPKGAGTQENSSGINLEGKPNLLHIEIDKLKLPKGIPLEKVSGFYIVVTDGAQYVGEESNYDCISFSGREHLTLSK